MENARVSFSTLSDPVFLEVFLFFLIQTPSSGTRLTILNILNKQPNVGPLKVQSSHVWNVGGPGDDECLRLNGELQSGFSPGEYVEIFGASW